MGRAPIVEVSYDKKKKFCKKKSVMIKKKVLQKKVENSDQTKVIVLFGSSMPTLCPFYTLEYNFC